MVVSPDILSNPVICLLGMGLLGIPQERIAQRLGMTQFVVHDHLLKNSELKKSINALLTKGFAINTIAEKLGWPIGTINSDLESFKNGENAENAPDPLRFADVWIDSQKV